MIRPRDFRWFAALIVMAGCITDPKVEGPIEPVPTDSSMTSLPLKLAPQPTVAAITAGDLMTRIYIFADDSMQGRASGSTGFDRAAAYLASELRRLGLKPAGDDGGYFQRFWVKQLGSETQTVMYNVVAVLPGSDSALAGEYVALGAHADHLGSKRGPLDHDSLRVALVEGWRLSGRSNNPLPLTASQRASIHVNVDSLRRLHPPRPDSIANGADDDGSGSMALLEIAEAFVGQTPRPRRSVLFVWHAGEELGLLGSQYFTTHSTVPRDSIVAQVNIDMIGRGSSSDLTVGGPDYLAVVGARRLSTQLGEIVETVKTSGNHDLRFDYEMDEVGHPQRIYCRSDHYSYARWGIPVAFFFTGLHADYHQVTDEPQYIDYSHYARITNYLSDLVATLANRDERPVVDGDVRNQGC